MEPIFTGLAALLLGKPVIEGLKGLKARQTIYEYAPESHRVKEGTPTMGGFLMLIATALAGILVALNAERSAYTAHYWLVWGGAMLFGLLGFLDDYLIRKWTGRRGFEWKIKLIAQLVLASAFVMVLMNAGAVKPVSGSQWFNLLFGIFWVVGWANAFNLTDGLDGLAAGLSAIALTALGVWSGEPAIALPAYCWAAACLGYLWWNTHPAQVFMGDTGSMALGAVFAGLSLQAAWEVPNILTGYGVPILIGWVFATEILTVVIQLTWVKTMGRRLFLATPIHHHFERLNWHESRIVVRFWIAGLLAAAAVVLWLK
jgi:phospho-N-acetylmuramoyl-pentapeptide-transferase